MAETHKKTINNYLITAQDKSEAVYKYSVGKNSLLILRKLISWISAVALDYFIV